MTTLTRNMAREDMKSENIIGGISAEKAKHARESLLDQDYEMVWNSLYEEHTPPYTLNHAEGHHDFHPQEGCGLCESIIDSITDEEITMFDALGQGRN